MYSIGEKVVYAGHGVCLIDGIEERTVDRKKISYFVLKPLDHGQTNFYVPVHNPAALAKLRYLLTPEQIRMNLQSPVLLQDCWIPEENRRKLRYKELANSGDFLLILQMVNTLLRQKEMQLAAGRKFHLCDENFLRDAKRILDSELSVVFDIPVSEIPQVIDTIKNRID